jgi:hypothetical protein
MGHFVHLDQSSFQLLSLPRAENRPSAIERHLAEAEALSGEAALHCLAAEVALLRQDELDIRERLAALIAREAAQ